MKKIVFVCDVNNFPSGAFKFVENLNETEALLLTGAFFHSANFDVVAPATVEFAPEPILAFTDTDIKAVNSSIEKFEQKCKQNGIEYRVHEESDVFKLDDFIKETRFADAVVMSEQLFFSHIDVDQPNSFMKDVLHCSECPLLVIPEDYSPVTHITIAYDGKKEIMFAIKQFCYLFPQYTQLPTDIVYWVDKTDDEIPDLDYLEEFAGRHFSNLNFKELFFDPKQYIADWSRKNKNTIFISGSYKRSGLSSILKKNFVEDMIKHPSAILFIAHNR
ncbi:hypothetical protein [Segetibacter koreensis]|uniref:hypothetical protein n=1 Tax=Segetibacter koreensis TaxID=398037 RepID=UPI0003629A24|nr:hypothetical protein [Segetibacter koreensis]